MRAVRRFLPAVSLLICLLLIALWGRSTVGDDYVGFTRVRPGRGSFTCKLYSAGGSIGLFFVWYSSGFDSGWAPGWYYQPSWAPNTTHAAPPGFLGFRYTAKSGTENGAVFTVTRAMVP